ncbi:MAG: DNA repair protein RecN [Spirochaetota bacterium]
MLSVLEIRNFVLIDKLRIKLGRGNNVLTGETGAGKSIIISALEIITGEKGSTLAVGPAADRLTVSGVFDIRDAKAVIMPKLTAWGITPENDEITIRREITKDGKSRSFIDHTGVKVSQLKEIGDVLVDIHGQHEHQSLFHTAFHLDFYDTFINANDLKSRFRTAFNALTSLVRRHREIVENRTALARERSFLEYAVNEISAAKLTATEETDVREEINKLSNFEKIASGISGAYEAVYGSDESALAMLGKALSAVQPLSEYDARFAEAAAMLEDISYRTGDVRDLIAEIKNGVKFDPARLEALNERLFLISSLKKKYGGTIPEVIAYGASAGEKLSLIDFSDEDIKKLEAEIAVKRREASALALELSELRRSSKDAFVGRIRTEIADLGMENAVFDVEMVREEDDAGVIEVDGARYKASAEGVDTVEFLIAPNKGSMPAPLRKIASGGEISRIMLAMKTVLADGDFTGTMVFDEIDVGVGGRIAEVIGEKLAALAEKKQVLVITHLAQIASHADTHFMVSKSDVDGRTVSNIELLSDEARVNEVARMIAGKEITDTSRAHAAEMLARAKG